MEKENALTKDLEEAVKRLRDWAANDDDCFDRAKKMSDSLEKVLTRAIIVISGQSEALCKLGESLSHFCETLAAMVAISVKTASESKEGKDRLQEIEERLAEFTKSESKEGKDRLQEIEERLAEFTKAFN